jgi:hypothetical protein
MSKIQAGLAGFLVLVTLNITGCKTSNAPTNTSNSTTARQNGSPQRVDIRGNILMSRYDQGQVMLEVEGLLSENTRYNRAYVLVLPTTQIVGPDGSSVSLSELRQGQTVAVLLRAGGKGNMVGVGVARKMWVE